MSWLVYDVEYLRSKKNWCVRVFKCLDHDEMVGSRIYISKDIGLRNMLFSAVH